MPAVQRQVPEAHPDEVPAVRGVTGHAGCCHRSLVKALGSSVAAYIDGLVPSQFQELRGQPAPLYATPLPGRPAGQQAGQLGIDVGGQVADEAAGAVSMVELPEHPEDAARDIEVMACHRHPPAGAGSSEPAPRTRTR